jgi:hypothetical protein
MHFVSEKYTKELEKGKIRIYILIDPLTNQIKYVGATKRKMGQRLNGHIYTALKSSGPNINKNNWINSLKLKGCIPIMDEIDIVNKDEIIFWETFYINLFRFYGFDLFNINLIGGGGLTS